jgi:predicted MFS family arabinose efflux permease
VGRALGGPLGGWLCDLVGWRWCFYGQVPPTLLGLFLILWKLPSKALRVEDGDEDESLLKKATRVDVAGAFTLAVTISIFLLTLHFVNEDLPLSNILILGVLFIFSAFLFYLVERRWAKEPILPLELVTNRAALSSYLLAGFQMAAQFSLFYSTPLYFQILSDSSVGDSGLRLVPAVVGNATAGLLSGYVISKTGRYKLLTILANLGGFLGYVLVLLRWRGATNWAETLYIAFGGFASGTNQSTAFIHLAASLDPSMIAIAGTAFYLSQNLFLLVGIQLATGVLHVRLRASLNTGLKGIKHKTRVCDFPSLPIHVIELMVRGIDHRICRLKR